jgi:hypothetical protein
MLVLSEKSILRNRRRTMKPEILCIGRIGTNSMRASAGAPYRPDGITTRKTLRAISPHEEIFRGVAPLIRGVVAMGALCADAQRASISS